VSRRRNEGTVTSVSSNAAMITGTSVHSIVAIWLASDCRCVAELDASNWFTSVPSCAFA